MPAVPEVTRPQPPPKEDIVPSESIFAIKTNVPSMVAAIDELTRRGYMKHVPYEPETLEESLKLLPRDTTMEEGRIITISLMPPAGITKTQARDITKLTEKLRKEVVDTVIKPLQKANEEVLGRFTELIPEIDRLRMAQAEGNLGIKGLARLRELEGKPPAVAKPPVAPAVPEVIDISGLEKAIEMHRDWVELPKKEIPGYPLLRQEDFTGLIGEKMSILRAIEENKNLDKALDLVNEYLDEHKFLLSRGVEEQGGWSQGQWVEYYSNVKEQLERRIAEIPQPLAVEEVKLGGGNPMPKTERERKSFHERIFGKGSTPPLERLSRGETLNNLLPMPPEEGPPLPRSLGLKWPWKK